MNDLREIRSKQADLSNAMRRSLPPDWWGRTADSNLKEKLRLGDRFKLCQVWLSSFGSSQNYSKTLDALRTLTNQESFHPIWLKNASLLLCKAQKGAKSFIHFVQSEDEPA